MTFRVTQSGALFDALRNLRKRDDLARPAPGADAFREAVVDPLGRSDGGQDDYPAQVGDRKLESRLTSIGTAELALAGEVQLTDARRC